MNLTPEQNHMLIEMRKALAEQFEMERQTIRQQIEAGVRDHCKCPINGTHRQQYIGRILDFIEDTGGEDGLRAGVDKLRKNHIWVNKMQMVSNKAAGIVGTVIIGAGLSAFWLLITGWDKIKTFLD